MANQKPIHSALALPARLRRRFIQQTTALSLCSALPLTAQVANASQKPRVVTRYVCEQKIYDSATAGVFGLQRCKMVSFIGEPQGDIESAFMALNNASDRYQSGYEIQSEWVCGARDYGEKYEHHDTLGLIMLRDCDPSSLQMLVAEAQQYQQRNIEIYIGSPNTLNATRLIQTAMAGLAAPWRIFQIARAVDKGGITMIDDAASRMVAYLETLFIPFENFSFPGIDYRDIQNLYAQQVVQVTRLRSHSLGGLKMLLENELARYAPEAALFLTAYSVDDSFHSIRTKHALIMGCRDVVGQNTDCVFAMAVDQGRANFDIYLSGCCVC